MVGVDRHPVPDVDEFYQVDLSEPDAIDELVDRLPGGAHGLCNIAGVAPTEPGEMVLRVNTHGLIRLTNGLVPKLSDGSSIVNLASMAGNGWRSPCRPRGSGIC